MPGTVRAAVTGELDPVSPASADGFARRRREIERRPRAATADRPFWSRAQFRFGFNRC